MKKFTVISTVFLLMFSLSAFTTVKQDVTIKIKAAFSKNFTSASEVTWTYRDEAYIASFKIQNEEYAASYDTDGSMLSISRYIPLAHLPMNVLLALDKSFKDYDINPSVIELSSDNSTTYFIKAANKKYKVKIKSDASGNLMVENKTKCNN